MITFLLIILNTILIDDCMVQKKQVNLKCKTDPNDDTKYNCSVEEEMKKFEIDQSTEKSETQIELEYYGVVKDSSSSKLVTSILLTSLISGFAFAFAYLLLYEIDNWVVYGEDYHVGWRLWVGLLIILFILFGLILGTYFLITRKSHENKKFINKKVDGKKMQLGDIDPRTYERLRTAN